MATTSDEDPAAEAGPARRERLEKRAREQAGVISRQELYAAGLTRGEVRAQVRARRWQRVGAHCLVVHTGPLSTEARHWVAEIESGPRGFIDGASALVLAGLKRYEPERIRVTVPRGARIRHRPSPSLDIRQTRRWSPSDLVEGERPRRARVPVAAVRAALWARSDRQALLVLTMTVQQRLCTVEEIVREMLRVRRDRRRSLIHEALIDLAGGIGSLAELDVLRGCRERGIPEPDLQAARRTASGSYFLDFRWSRWRTVLEVDGIQHTWAEHLVGDALRHNSIAIDGDVVLRMPVLGLRVCPDDFFDQVRRSLHRAGWAA
jgi:hypothetical protein